MRGKKSFVGLIAVLAIVTASLLSASQATAQTETILHSFGDGTDGDFPNGSLIFDASGNLYGTTEGTTARCNGAPCGGTVYEMTPEAGGGWTETVLYYFGSSGISDGSEPMAGLVADTAGNFYGTTRYGGTESSYGQGTIFELSPSLDGGWAEKVLYAFTSETYEKPDGTNPTTSLVMDAGGNLYGTTEYGGSTDCDFPNGCGVVFELSPSAGGSWTEKVIHTFNTTGEDGNFPEAGLAIDHAGNLYGTTSAGGSGYGTVFELMPAAGGKWTEKMLHRFTNNGKDGYWPTAGVILDAYGNVYGVTPWGGIFGNANFQGGTAFELTPTANGGWSEKMLHNFGNLKIDTPSSGLVLDASGNLFGATYFDTNQGTVYELSPAAGGTWTHKTLHNFGSQKKDGVKPLCNLILDGSGNLYGTTLWGGEYGEGGLGTAYEIVP